MYTVLQMIPEHRDYLAENDMDLLFKITVDGKVTPATVLAHYQTVAEISAPSLEDVFRVSNLNIEDKITRIRKMHSVSVGDVIADEDNELFVVSPFGFEKVEELA
tara:strand:+ start:504 stop:818 length:315 start_codon:yes stop_codon:yes gene_type:complete